MSLQGSSNRTGVTLGGFKYHDCMSVLVMGPPSIPPTQGDEFGAGGSVIVACFHHQKNSSNHLCFTSQDRAGGCAQL